MLFLLHRFHQIVITYGHNRGTQTCGDMVASGTQTEELSVDNSSRGTQTMLYDVVTAPCQHETCLLTQHLPVPAGGSAGEETNIHIIEPTHSPVAVCTGEKMVSLGKLPPSPVAGGSGKQKKDPSKLAPSPVPGCSSGDAGVKTPTQNDVPLDHTDAKSDTNTGLLYRNSGDAGVETPTQKSESVNYLNEYDVLLNRV